MANRLSQIATRTGDDGTTGLGDNTRVSKASARPHAMGDVDELNSHIGVLLCEDMPAAVRTLRVEVQHQLFDQIMSKIDFIALQHVRRIGGVQIKTDLAAFRFDQGVGAARRHDLNGDLAFQLLLERIEGDAANLHDPGGVAPQDFSTVQPRPNAQLSAQRRQGL